jgi:hypothetical protein
VSNQPDHYQYWLDSGLRFVPTIDQNIEFNGFSQNLEFGGLLKVVRILTIASGQTMKWTKWLNNYLAVACAEIMLSTSKWWVLIRKHYI